MRPLLVTCGATRNPVDAIRFMSAYSSGRTGVAIAEQRAAAGGRVHLLGSPEAALRVGGGVTAEVYGATRDLMARMKTWITANPGGVVVHAAAVGDYEAPPEASKIPSGLDELVIRLRRTPKIADHVRGWDPGVFFVTFKAASPETTPDQLVGIARRQLDRTGSDLVFANVIGALSKSVILVEADTAAAIADRGAAIAALVARLP